MPFAQLASLSPCVLLAPAIHCYRIYQDFPIDCSSSRRVVALLCVRHHRHGWLTGHSICANCVRSSIVMAPLHTSHMTAISGTNPNSTFRIGFIVCHVSPPIVVTYMFNVHLTPTPGCRLHLRVLHTLLHRHYLSSGH